MTEWHNVLKTENLPEGRVTTVTAGHKSIALVHNLQIIIKGIKASLDWRA